MFIFLQCIRTEKSAFWMIIVLLKKLQLEVAHIINLPIEVSITLTISRLGTSVHCYGISVDKYHSSHKAYTKLCHSGYIIPTSKQ